YTALVRALERATELGVERAHIQSDSELLVKQMKGEYRVKHPELRLLHARAKNLCDRFQEVTFAHVPRSENRRADQLCNQALDSQRGTKVAHDSGRKERPDKKSAREEPAREEALNCLRAVARSWSQGDPDAPSPEDVLEQIWSILEENGLFK